MLAAFLRFLWLSWTLAGPVAVLPGTAAAQTWPALAAPLPATGGGENDAALIVAIEKYADIPGVPGAVQNANAWYAFLTATRKVPADRVFLLRDRQGTVERIRTMAARVASVAKPGGTTWLVFIGHGAPSQDGKDGELVGYDAQQDVDALYARSIKQGEILSALKAGAQAHTVVIIDACFSGRLPSGGAIAPGLQPLIAVKALSAISANTTVLTAGAADEFAGPLSETGRPAFSYLLLGALRGWADTNRDSRVTAEEAVSYARSTLRVVATGRSQTPQIAGDQAVVLARRATEPAPDLGAIVVGPTAGGATTTPEKAAPPPATPPAVRLYGEIKEIRYLDLTPAMEKEMRKIVNLSEGQILNSLTMDEVRKKLEKSGKFFAVNVWWEGLDVGLRVNLTALETFRGSLKKANELIVRERLHYADTGFGWAHLFFESRELSVPVKKLDIDACEWLVSLAHDNSIQFRFSDVKRIGIEELQVPASDDDSLSRDAPRLAAWGLKLELEKATEVHVGSTSPVNRVELYLGIEERGPTCVKCDAVKAATARVLAECSPK